MQENIDNIVIIITHLAALSAEAVKYADCIFATTNKYPGYDIKPSDSETPVLDLWGMWSTPSLALLSGPLWLRVVVPVRVVVMNQIEIFNNLQGIIICIEKKITVKYQYLKAFNSMQTINSNT